MEYRNLGATGMQVSSLSLGASSLGGVFHDIDEGEGIETVHAALDHGINFIDVSPYYGFLKAEKVLGQALRGVPRSRYLLSTKVGRYGQDGAKSWDYSAQRAIWSVEESLERLHVSHLDLLSVHDVEFSNLDQVIHETLPALHTLKAAGLVRHVGITGLPLDKLCYIIDRVPAGTVETVLSFCHYCLHDDSLGAHLAYFAQQGIGVINASPLSMGMLSERGAPAWHPASSQLQERARAAAAFCKRRGYPIEKLAIEFSVGNAAIPTTLVSTASPKIIAQNIAWAAAPPDGEILAGVRDILRPVLGETWNNS